MLRHVKVLTFAICARFVIRCLEKLFGGRPEGVQREFARLFFIYTVLGSVEERARIFIFGRFLCVTAIIGSVGHLEAHFDLRELTLRVLLLCLGFGSSLSIVVGVDVCET